MSPEQILDDEPRRPIWLITLADVMLLLVGFFVFLQANPALDGKAFANGLREGFGVAPDLAMAVAADRIEGFAPASATLPPAAETLSWARQAARDPRALVRIVGGTDGTATDVDAATGSAAILAADRARAVAALLSQSVPSRQIAIEARPGAGRAVQLDLAFAGQQP